MVQSGQGADEVFGGYHWYPPLADIDDDAAGVDAYRRVFFDRSHADLLGLLQPGMDDAGLERRLRAGSLRDARRRAARSTAHCGSTPR